MASDQASGSDSASMNGEAMWASLIVDSRYASSATSVHIGDYKVVLRSQHALLANVLRVFLMQHLRVVFILVLASCEGGWDVVDLEGPQNSQTLQGDPRGLGPRGLESNMARQELQDRQPPQQVQGAVGAQSPTAPLAMWNSMPGSSASTAGASCQALLNAGVTLSGVYWVINPTAADPSQVGLPVRVYCDQDINGGGWALVYNSVLGAATLDFWNIPHAQRLGRRGRPSLDSNYYDGSLYQTSSVTYMDVIEDLQGRTAVAFVARSAGIIWRRRRPACRSR